RVLRAGSGWLEGGAHAVPSWAGIRGDVAPRHESGGTIRAYGGDGTLVAGVMRCMAPQAQVHVANIFGTGGSARESDVAMSLMAAFGFGAEIVHITASFLTRQTLPPMALEP